LTTTEGLKKHSVFHIVYGPVERKGQVTERPKTSDEPLEEQPMSTVRKQVVAIVADRSSSSGSYGIPKANSGSFDDFGIGN
jgi:hypothetical protein